MVEKVIGQLNKQVLKKLDTNIQLPNVKSPDKSTSFSVKLDNKISDKLVDKVREDYGMKAGPDSNVINADSIKIEMANPEVKAVGQTASNTFYDSVKMLNKDLLSMDSALEALTKPGVKYTPKQLLTLQAGISQVTILAEGFTRIVQETAKTVNTLGTQIQV